MLDAETAVRLSFWSAQTCGLARIGSGVWKRWSRWNEPQHACPPSSHGGAHITPGTPGMVVGLDIVFWSVPPFGQKQWYGCGLRPGGV
jgi:hypothetical protein